MIVLNFFKKAYSFLNIVQKKLGNVENKVSKILIDGQLEDFDVEVENNE